MWNRTEIKQLCFCFISHALPHKSVLHIFENYFGLVIGSSGLHVPLTVRHCNTTVTRSTNLYKNLEMKFVGLQIHSKFLYKLARNRDACGARNFWKKNLFKQACQRCSLLLCKLLWDATWLSLHVGRISLRVCRGCVNDLWSPLFACSFLHFGDDPLALIACM